MHVIPTETFSLPNIPVVLFGNHIAAYGVIRALGPLGVPIFLVSQSKKANLCRYSKYVKSRLYVDCKAPDFLSQLLAWGKQKVGDHAILIIAGSDDPLDVLPGLRDQLPAGWIPTFPSPEIVKRVRKKANTYEIARSIGIASPVTFLVRNESELNAALTSDKLRFPLLMKAERSSDFLKKFGRKAVSATKIEDVVNNYHVYERFLGELLLQEKVEGGNDTLWNYIAVYDTSSNPVAGFGNRKVRTSAEYSSCTLMENFQVDELRLLSDKLVKEIGYIGYANMEVKYDSRDGEMKLMEINGRVSMSVSHALSAEINLPLAIYLSAQQIELPTDMKWFQDRSKEGRHLWWYPFGEMSLIAKSIWSRKWFPTNYFREMSADGIMIEPFNLKDPVPAAFQLLSFLGSLASAFLRRAKRSSAANKKLDL
jgi:D-aspartate ligase